MAWGGVGSFYSSFNESFVHSRIPEEVERVAAV
jgi:hypothetical protein